MNEIEKVEKSETITKEVLSEYLATMFSGANKLLPKEQLQFVEIAHAFQLNPFKKEIYCIAYGEGQGRVLSIITGYEVYLKRAESTGLLSGWRVWTEGNLKDNTLKAKIEIHRKDREMPFYWEVPYCEYVQKTRDGKPTKFWSEKPETMIKKVAISQGFRLCFSVEIGGMPYTADELPESMTKYDLDPKQEIKQPDPFIKIVNLLGKNKITQTVKFFEKYGINRENALNFSEDDILSKIEEFKIHAYLELIMPIIGVKPELDKEWKEINKKDLAMVAEFYKKIK